jgi:hypothetical protein
VLFPINAEAKISILKNWDLWGPAILAAIFLLVIGSKLIFIQPTTNLM